MKFTPKTEAEIQLEGLLPKGEYPFEVVSAKEKTSKKGNEMIEVKLEIFAEDGSSRFLFDYLMEKMAFKLRHFCASTKLIASYEAGTLKASDIQGKAGVCKVGVKEDPTGEFLPKNEIKDYVFEAAGVQQDAPEPKRDAKKPAVVNELENDDIPF